MTWYTSPRSSAHIQCDLHDADCERARHRCAGIIKNIATDMHTRLHRAHAHAQIVILSKYRNRTGNSYLSRARVLRVLHKLTRHENGACGTAGIVSHTPERQMMMLVVLQCRRFLCIPLGMQLFASSLAWSSNPICLSRADKRSVHTRVCQLINRQIIHTTSAR